MSLPNDAESRELVRGVLEGLAFEFSDEAVDLDVKVHNAARIWKLYGTTARKGDNTPERPHLRSALLEVPEGGAVEVVDREILEAVARSKPSTPRDKRRFDTERNSHKDFDLDAWIREHNIPIKR